MSEKQLKPYFGIVHGHEVSGDRIFNLRLAWAESEDDAKYQIAVDVLRDYPSESQAKTVMLNIMDVPDALIEELVRYGVKKGLNPEDDGILDGDLLS